MQSSCAADKTLFAMAVALLSLTFIWVYIISVKRLFLMYLLHCIPSGTEVHNLGLHQKRGRFSINPGATYEEDEHVDGWWCGLHPNLFVTFYLFWAFWSSFMAVAIGCCLDLYPDLYAWLVYLIYWQAKPEMRSRKWSRVWIWERIWRNVYGCLHSQLDNF
jgi:hypothetical protein